jgi:hypothetical protein
VIDVGIAALVATLLGAGWLVLRARPVGATAVWIWG